jgi:1,2-dihydroxy-3-keto-5-methylthiopentene dioxygenase
MDSRFRGNDVSFSTMNRNNMSTLTIFDESGKKISNTDQAAQITAELNKVGILFKRWTARFAIDETMSSEDILRAYKKDINKFVAEGGYQTVDVISMHKNHPDKMAFRNKFLSEHTHSEDEIRFFVRGQGLFTLHIADKVYAVLCCQNDLISVPAGTPHWFDMSDNPEFTAIRFFNNPTGWVANYTGSAIAEKFPLLN